MIITLFKMSRPVNIAIAMVTLCVGYFLMGFAFWKGVGIGVPNLILELLGFAFAIGFANIQNDILDLESDRMNRPERPLVRGMISLPQAKAASIAGAILTLLCGLIDSLLLWQSSSPDTAAIPALFFIALTLLLVAYNSKLKHIPLLKNMTVAFLCATPLILNWLHSPVLNLDSLGKLYPAMLFAFLLTTAREIYKDLEDETGDLKAGIMTFPLIAGSTTARRFAGAIILFAWILLPLPVMQSYYPQLFLILTAITMTPSLGITLLMAGKKNYRKAQSTTKIAMFLGLISLVISAAV